MKNGLFDDPERYFWRSVGICPIPGCGAVVTHSVWGEIVNYMCSHCFYFWSEPITTGVYAEGL
jgi:hypothetical protein